MVKSRKQEHDSSDCKFFLEIATSGRGNRLCKNRVESVQYFKFSFNKIFSLSFSIFTAISQMPLKYYFPSHVSALIYVS